MGQLEKGAEGVAKSFSNPNILVRGAGVAGQPPGGRWLARWEPFAGKQIRGLFSFSGGRPLKLLPDELHLKCSSSPTTVSRGSDLLYCARLVCMKCFSQLHHMVSSMVDQESYFSAASLRWLDSVCVDL